MPYKDVEKRNARQRAYSALHRERYREHSKNHYLRNKAADPDYARKRSEKGRAAQKANPDKYKAQLRRYANLPTPTRPESKTCECCGKLPGKKGITLDHCHVSGVFRGWMCSRCNLGIGLLGDSIDGLMNAVRYLERARGNADKGKIVKDYQLGAPDEP